MATVYKLCKKKEKEKKTVVAQLCTSSYPYIMAIFT